MVNNSSRLHSAAQRAATFSGQHSVRDGSLFAATGPAFLALRLVVLATAGQKAWNCNCESYVEVAQDTLDANPYLAL